MPSRFNEQLPYLITKYPQLHPKRVFPREMWQDKESRALIVEVFPWADEPYYKWKLKYSLTPVIFKCRECGKIFSTETLTFDSIYKQHKKVCRYCWLETEDNSYMKITPNFKTYNIEVKHLLQKSWYRVYSMKKNKKTYNNDLMIADVTKDLQTHSIGYILEEYKGLVYAWKRS